MLIIIHLAFETCIFLSNSLAKEPEMGKAAGQGLRRCNASDILTQN